jgi:hypothetical protein
MVTREEYLVNEDERDKETRIECEIYSKENKSKFKSRKIKKGEDAEDHYFDHSARNVRIGERSISSFYTPYGIKGIDSWLSKQIKFGDPHPLYTRDEIANLIKRNPHLSDVIKTNLLSNLESYYNAQYTD